MKQVKRDRWERTREDKGERETNKNREERIRRRDSQGRSENIRRNKKAVYIRVKFHKKKSTLKSIRRIRQELK